MAKKSKKILYGSIIIVLLIISVIGVWSLTRGPVQQAFTDGEYIQAPTFYFYECAPASERVTSTTTSISTGASGWINAPKDSQDWDLYLQQTESTSWYSASRRFVIQVCHSNGACDSQRYEYANGFLSNKGFPTTVQSNLLTSDRVYVNYQYQNLLGQWKDQPNGAQWYQTYIPFILHKQDMFGVGRVPYTTPSQGCTFPTSTSQLDSKSGGILYSAQKFINLVIGSSKQFPTQVSSNDHLNPYETRNFIGNYVPIAAANVNFVTYNGQQGYCLNKQVFSITQVNTNGATYKIVDSNFNTRLASSVECCPGDKEPTRMCNSNFKWEDISVAECSYFKPCGGSDWSPSASKTLMRYNCINSKCVAETKVVDCTSNSDCGSNQACSRLTWECEDVQPGPVTCKDGTAPVNGVCPDDKLCELKCEDDYGSLNPNRLFCKWGCGISNWFKTYQWYLIGGFVGMIVLFILVYLLKPNKTVVNRNYKK